MEDEHPRPTALDRKWRNRRAIPYNRTDYKARMGAIVPALTVLIPYIWPMIFPGKGPSPEQIEQLSALLWEVAEGLGFAAAAAVAGYGLVWRKEDYEIVEPKDPK